MHSSNGLSVKAYSLPLDQTLVARLCLGDTFEIACVISSDILSLSTLLAHRTSSLPLFCSDRHPKVLSFGGAKVLPGNAFMLSFGKNIKLYHYDTDSRCYSPD